jgi:hypothetical protein
MSRNANQDEWDPTWDVLSGASDSIDDVNGAFRRWSRFTELEAELRQRREDVERARETGRREELLHARVELNKVMVELVKLRMEWARQL